MGRVGGQMGDRLTGFANEAANTAAKRFKSWSGFGDYKIKANSLINSVGDGGMGPTIRTDGRGITVRYREYIGEVMTGPVSGEFFATTYTVNPANFETFPWLNPIAQQYDQYKMNGVIFEFRSTATDYSTTASLGSVMIATEYDVSGGDPKYTNKSQMMNSAYASETKMSTSMLHGLECDPSELQRNIFYTRGYGRGLDALSDSDLALTTVATQGGGLPANQSVGSLYVHYEVELFKEHLWNGAMSEGRLYSTWGAPSHAVIAQNWPELFGLTTFGPSGFYEPPLVGGRDLGIVFSANAINIPRRFAGVTFKVTFSIGWATPYALGLMTAGVNQFCTNRYALPTSLLQVGVWSAVNRTGETMSGTLGVAYFTVDDIVNAEYAQWANANMGFMPPADLGVVSWLNIEVVNSDFNELQ